MNKKQRNRKIVTQNNRNRMINRRYSSTIKTLFKLFTKKMKPNPEEENLVDVKQTKQIMNNLYSIIDKAVKKGVIHKNTAARKKARVVRIFQHNIKFLETTLKI